MGRNVDGYGKGKIAPLDWLKRSDLTFLCNTMGYGQSKY